MEEPADHLTGTMTGFYGVDKGKEDEKATVVHMEALKVFAAETGEAYEIDASSSWR